MANISASLRWWDEWQMRILICGSLFIHWFLLVSAPMRRYIIPSGLRFLIWLAYNSGDAVAIYALATIFSRQTKASSPCHVGYKASSIEVLWAPILLIHLGSRVVITAFNIQDDELWTRQAVTLLSQVTIGLYSFSKTWPRSSDSRLLGSAILLFVAGILSFWEKAMACRRASNNRLVAVSVKAVGMKRKPYVRVARKCCCACWESLIVDICACGKEMLLRLHTANDTAEMSSHRQQASRDQQQDNSYGLILSELDKVQMILSDLSLLAAATDLKSRRRGSTLTMTVRLAVAGGDRSILNIQRRAFGLLYTRDNVMYTLAYMPCPVVLIPSLHVAAIVLFATSHKEAYKQFNAIDVRITYIVLCLTAVLDVFGVLISELVYRILSSANIGALSDRIPLYNLIDGALESNKLVRRVLNCLGCDGSKVVAFFNRDRDGTMYLKVAGMVLLAVVQSGRESLIARDFASYRSSTRGKNWILGRLTAFDTIFGDPNCQMFRSLRGLPFDVSVLHWHIATDLCFRSSSPGSWQQATSLHRECAAGISNYMAYLLYSRTEMLMMGSRKHLFAEAMEDTGLLLGQQPPPADGFRVAKFIEDATSASHPPLVHDACVLAAELMEMAEATRWEVMYSVWIGMLCYSASMCRGNLLAKSLDEGGEFLCFVSLVIALKGGKTLADKLQMPDHDQGATQGEVNSN